MIVGAFALMVSPAFAAGEIPVAEQNALVQKYCAVCHTDNARNGGLSLEHFDASTAPPSLAAMMLSKIAGGLSLDVLQTAASHAETRALVEKNIQGGAMNAAGISPPPLPVTSALVAALTQRAADAGRWSLFKSADGVVSISSLRETPLSETDAEMFRLTVACDTSAGSPAMQLDWSPVPKLGDLSVSVDRQSPVQYQIEGIEKMGNGGSGKTTGRASASLDRSWSELPKERLSATGLFPGTVVFPFSTLTDSMRQALAPCFPTR